MASLGGLRVGRQALSDEFAGRQAGIEVRLLRHEGDPGSGTEEEQQSMLAGMSLELVVPLRWRGDLVGALLLGRKLTGTDLTSEDVWRRRYGMARHDRGPN